MKKIQLSVLTLLTCSNLLMAGGELLMPITPYEIKDVNVTKVISEPSTPIVKAPVAVVAPVVTSEENNISSAYLGLGLVATRYDSRCLSSAVGCDGTENAAGLLLRVGYDFNEYVGLEGRALMTLFNDDGGKIKHFGAFVKPMYPLTDELNAYGLLGFEKTTTSGTLREIDVSGLAFGLGLEYDISSDDENKDVKYNREFDGIADQEKGLGIFIDYERLYYKSNGPDLDAVSLGLTYDF